MTAEETFAREIVPLRNIRDNNEKIILTLDKVTLGNYDGIRIIHLLDWLLTQIKSFPLQKAASPHYSANKGKRLCF